MLDTNLFRTHLVTWPSEAAQIDGMGVDPEWRLSTQDDPSFRHWTDPTKGKGRITLEGEITDEEIRRYAAHQVRCKEILIKCDDAGIASNVGSLIQTGTLLGYPDMLNAPRHFGAAQVIAKTEELMRGKPFCTWFAFQENALFACRVAVAAWADRSLRYAIEKYRLSLELDSFTPHSASPRYGQVFLNRHPEYSYHVRAATAVLIAYSVIEELGLEIRSSNKKPRWKDEAKALWNPVVKGDAEQRLRGRGIDLSDPVYWVYRGEPSPLELAITPQLGIPSEEADGTIVRDRKMEMVDALHKASYIRNFVVAHRYADLVSELGPYDVHNVQLLARRLILSSLGLYKLPEYS